jgi:hypothetical protein
MAGLAKATARMPERCILRHLVVRENRRKRLKRLGKRGEGMLLELPESHASR